MCAVVGLTLAPAPHAGARPEREATLSRVVDGDTLELASGQRVRLIGIDTPETHHPRFGDECYGKAATRFVQGLLADGERIRLVRDVEELDRYGRLLAYVYRTSDNLFVNAEIVREGYAYVATEPPNVAHADELRRLAAKARRAKRGLWSKCDPGPGHGGQRPLADPSAGCLPGYQDVCVPPGPPDLDCDDLPPGPIRVTGSDPHQLDGDGDGVACG